MSDKPTIKALQPDGALQVILDMQAMAGQVKHILVVVVNDEGQLILRRSTMPLAAQSHMIAFMQSDHLSRIAQATSYQTSKK